jgi:DNA-binding Xre family transcriptional regulator
MSSTRLSSEVAAARGARRWSQRELAHRSGVSLATIGSLERGSDRTFTSATLSRLDDVFEWPPGHARTLMIDHESHDTLATLQTPSSPAGTTIVIDGEVSSVATSPRGEQVSRIITVVTQDGTWMLSRVSVGEAGTSDDDPMPVVAQGDHVHYAFHFVPKSPPR